MELVNTETWNLKHYLKKAKMSYILDSLDECREFFELYRVVQLKEAMDTVFEHQGERRNEAIFATAETLMSSGNKDLKNYAMKKMRNYDASNKN